VILWKYPLHLLQPFFTDMGQRLYGYGFLLKFGQHGLMVAWLDRTIPTSGVEETI